MKRKQNRKPTGAAPVLEQALSQSQEVQMKIERSADELESATETASGSCSVARIARSISAR